MTVATEQPGSPSGSPFNAEDLVRSLGEEPPVSAEFRTRVLAAATEASATSTRKKGWLIAAGFSIACAACVMMVAVLHWGGTNNGPGLADENPAVRTNGEDLLNRAIHRDGELISGGVGQ